MRSMPLIMKPGPKKQELLNRYSWVRSFLLMFDVINPNIKMQESFRKKAINTFEETRNNYLLAEDDDYNFNTALETLHMLENGLMETGIDVEAGVQLVMERNGFKTFAQMKPNRPDLIRAFLEEDAPIVIGDNDPWDRPE